MTHPRRLVEHAKADGRRKLLEHEVYELLGSYGLPIPRYKLAKSVDEAVKAAEEIGYPVVLKVVSPDIIHKSDVGGVKLGLHSPEDVKRAFNEIVDNVSKSAPGARIVGVLVQEMVPDGLEVLVGGVRDETFGPVIAFGLGGVFVEVYRDVSFRVAPLARVDALSMMREVRAWRLLEGYRGLPPRDIEAIADVIMRVSSLMMDIPEIKELDINPLMVYEAGRGAKIADARVILG
ncbi:ATP-grasp domain protein [Pyrolobus fumarii 1A]|uniref:ATP-grasp domain protein n=1 Tax=Pyrolobus fumarii (strain DSM 11204 / 1A) TaxID=694429 RepID=G0EH44_PYRF1|nr:acetate--CoA ligase family protein [Pyrolobus fumarii]AEM39268.1 ATP-grasp domain protein [Pyrolobus fumarii 1A]